MYTDHSSWDRAIQPETLQGNRIPSGTRHPEDSARPRPDGRIPEGKPKVG